MLSTKVGLEFLVRRESVVFLAEEVNVHIARFVVDKADIEDGS